MYFFFSNRKYKIIKINEIITIVETHFIDDNNSAKGRINIRLQKCTIHLCILTALPKQLYQLECYRDCVCFFFAAYRKVIGHLGIHCHKT